LSSSKPHFLAPWRADLSGYSRSDACPQPSTMRKTIMTSGLPHLSKARCASRDLDKYQGEIAKIVFLSITMRGAMGA
jgi:hypothetical protein